MKKIIKDMLSNVYVYEAQKLTQSYVMPLDTSECVIPLKSIIRWLITPNANHGFGDEVVKLLLYTAMQEQKSLRKDKNITDQLGLILSESFHNAVVMDNVVFDKFYTDYMVFAPENRTALFIINSAGDAFDLENARLCEKFATKVSENYQKKGTGYKAACIYVNFNSNVKGMYLKGWTFLGSGWLEEFIKDKLDSNTTEPCVSDVLTLFYKHLSEGYYTRQALEFESSLYEIFLFYQDSKYIKQYKNMLKSFVNYTFQPSKFMHTDLDESFFIKNRYLLKELAKCSAMDFIKREMIKNTGGDIIFSFKPVKSIFELEFTKWNANLGFDINDYPLYIKAYINSKKNILKIKVKHNKKVAQDCAKDSISAFFSFSENCDVLTKNIIETIIRELLNFYEQESVQQQLACVLETTGEELPTMSVSVTDTDEDDDI